MNIKKSSHKKDFFHLKSDGFVKQAKTTLFDISYCKLKSFLNCTCSNDKKISKLEQAFIIDQRTLQQIIAIGTVDIKTSKQISKNVI